MRLEQTTPSGQRGVGRSPTNPKGGRVGCPEVRESPVLGAQRAGDALPLCRRASGIYQVQLKRIASFLDSASRVADRSAGPRYNRATDDGHA